MAKVYVTEIQSGMILGKQISNKTGKILFPIGHIITLPDISILMANGIDNIETAEITANKEQTDSAYLRRLKSKVHVNTVEELIAKISEIQVERFTSLQENVISKELCDKSLKFIISDKYKL